MCGIAGYISARTWDDNAMLAALHHRGPDNQGSFCLQISDKKLFFGHTRLSILDLSSKGNQPMENNDGSVVISYNGEVYNFRELRTKHFKNAPFKSDTDTEVILKLYEKKGIDFVNDLNGDFAISIYDKTIEKVYLMRDRMGVKPLYYHYQNGDLHFASEIKSLLAGGIAAHLNKEYLPHFFTFKYVPEDKTLFKNIYRLSPGHILTYDIKSGTVDFHQYWKPNTKPEYASLSYEDAKSETFRLIEDACDLRLIADVPIGTFLSGGLDSSIIAHFVKENKAIKHFCAGKEAPDLAKEGTTSDSFYAKKIARDWDLDLDLISIGGDQLKLEMIRETIEYNDDIIADGSQIPSFLITQQAAQKSRVILSGMGADELFLGYAGHQLMLLDQYVERAPKLFSEPILSYWSNLNVGKGPFMAYKRYLQKFGNYHEFGTARFAMYNIVGDYESSRSIFIDQGDDMEAFLSSYFPENEDPFNSLANFEWNNFLVKNLHYTDRMSMANSVENRVPFLDHRIVELAMSLPREFKLSNTFKPKRILKDTFKGHIPGYVLQRRKAGFGMPLRSLLSDQKILKELLQSDFFS
jgi:asparagine synthase (glutamine-hydrolysing)